MLFLPLALFLVVAHTLSFKFVHALSETVVDDQDPSITYSPISSWTSINGGEMDAGGTHMVTDDPAATATISSTFITAHFWSAKWPYPVASRLVIDGQTFDIDLQDKSYSGTSYGGAATVSSAVVASFYGQSSGEHTIVVSPVPGVKYAVLDIFTFEVADTPPEDDPQRTSSESTGTIMPMPTPTASSGSSWTLTSTTPGSTSYSTSQSSTSPSLSAVPFSTMPTAVSNSAPDSPSPNSGLTHKTSKSLAIAIGAGAGITSLGALIYLVIFCRRRKRTQEVEDPFNDPIIPYPDTSAPPYSGDSPFHLSESRSSQSGHWSITPPSPAHHAARSVHSQQPSTPLTRPASRLPNPYSQHFPPPPATLRVTNNPDIQKASFKAPSASFAKVTHTRPLDFLSIDPAPSLFAPPKILPGRMARDSLSSRYRSEVLSTFSEEGEIFTASRVSRIASRFPVTPAPPYQSFADTGFLASTLRTGKQ